MTIKDYSVSQEEFTLVYNSVLELYRTNPVPDELGKYYESEAYISHTDSRKTLFDRLYQWVKSYNLKHKIAVIKRYKKGNIHLLDIGAGTGDFVLSSKKYAHWEAMGIEPSEKARAKAEEKGLLLQADFSELLPHSFDVITMWHVLEHVPDVTQEIQIISNLLKENGIAVIAVPNYRSWDAQHYKELWAAYDVPRHLWHFSQESIRLLFTEKGFQLIGVKPMPFDAFYVSLLSEKYKTGSMNFLKGGYQGLLSNLSALKTGEYSSLIYLLKLHE